MAIPREEQEEENAVAGMIADTEQEIFEHASGKTPDENDGDRELEKMDDVHGKSIDDTGETEDDEGEDGPKDGEAEEADQDDEADPDQPETDEEAGERQHIAADARMVPSHRLREEAAARRAAEAERESLKAQISELRIRQEALEKKSTPAAEKPPKPDMFADPEGYEKWVLDEADRRADARYDHRIAQDRQAQLNQRAQLVEQSLQAVANSERGEEFNRVYGYLTSLDPRNPTNQEAVRKIVESPDPGSAIFEWRDNLLAQLQGRPRSSGAPARQSGQQRARNVTRGPVSLNGAAGQGTHRTIDPDMYDDSEGSVFDYATRR